MTHSWPAPQRGAFRMLLGTVITVAAAGLVPVAVDAQDAPALTDPGPAQAVPEGPSRLPGFVTLGMGFGQRFDPCAQCASPQNTASFTGHASLGKYLVDGFAIGVDVSAWRRGHPGTPIGADSVTVGTPISLVNQLGNASLVFSYDYWHIYVRGGVGIAMGQQDVQDGAGEVSTAKGMGVGYTVGGGATLPLASMVSLAFFVNYNAGSYDLATPVAVLERGVRHEFIELGFGVTVR